MPKIDWLSYDDDTDTEPMFDPIRRNTDPVSYRQSTQRRAEDMKNRAARRREKYNWD